MGILLPTIDNSVLQERCDAVFQYSAITGFPLKQELWLKDLGHSSEIVSEESIDRIALHPGVTVTDLANMVRKTPSACSQLVRRLRDKGWVEQVRNTANNRQVMLRLTPAGEHVYRDHAAFDKQCQALTFRRLEGFTEAELATYLSIQRRINEAYADDVRRSREYFT